MRYWQGLVHRGFRLFYITTDLATQWLYWISKGALGHKQAGRNILLLTTIGRKSGKSRTHALLYVNVESGWVVVASNGGNPKNPDWYFNLINTPKAKIQVGKFTYQVEAHVVSGSEYANLWNLLLEAWPAYATYQTGIARKIPIFILIPFNTARRDPFAIITKARITSMQ